MGAEGEVIPGLRRQELRLYQAHGLVVLDDEGGRSEVDLARIRRIRRLRRDLGLSYDEIGVVLRLVERIERLQAVQGTISERSAVRVTVVGP
jgi:DNA-binding transcriptional MerR regulator